MVGAVINSLRYELHDTGELPYREEPKPPCRDCGDSPRTDADLAGVAFPAI